MTNSTYKRTYVPVTPGGTLCTWLESATPEQAWAKLLRDAAHMPYKTQANFEKRGYCVTEFKPGWK
jgi:hypothetical protein